MSSTVKESGSLIVVAFLLVVARYLLGLEKKESIDLSGLTQDEITALLALIKAMKK